MPRMVEIGNAWVNPCTVVMVTEQGRGNGFNVHMLNGMIVLVEKYNGAIIINDMKMILDALDRGLNYVTKPSSGDDE